MLFGLNRTPKPHPAAKIGKRKDSRLALEAGDELLIPHAIADAHFVPDGLNARFHSWLADQFSVAELGTEAQRSLLRDDDNDGNIALAEYAFGGDPRRADNCSQIFSRREASNFLLEHQFNSDARDLTFRVERSRDLLFWETVPDIELQVEEVLGASPLRRYFLPPDPSDLTFYRIRVRQTP